jgi:hypothetical protein
MMDRQQYLHSAMVYDDAGNQAYKCSCINKDDFADWLENMPDWLKVYRVIVYRESTTLYEKRGYTFPETIEAIAA